MLGVIPGRLTALAAVAVVAVILTGCAAGSQQSPAASGPAPVTVAADPGPPPAPEALADVLYRLADPAVTGADKLRLVQNSAPADAAALDGFAAALRDGGFQPVNFAASDVRWSGDRPGDALATVTVTTTNPANPSPFTFPIEFSDSPDGWRLTRQTAEMLFAFGDSRTPGG